MRSYSKIIDAQYRALGAIPQTMAFSEMYTGLQSGVIDGQDTVPINMSSQKLYEVQEYGVLTYHRHPVYALITNKKFWDGLPPDIRKILDDAVVEATRFNNAIAQKENADALAALKASGFEAFGANRCMFESNFPVDKGSYSFATGWNAFKRLTAGASATDRQALFEGTASRVYRLI